MSLSTETPRSQAVELLVNTRITGLRVDPSRVVVGGTVTITGIAEHLLPWPWGWQPLPNVEVGFLLDNTKVDAKTTSADGGFRFERVFSSLGTYRVKVRFDGDWLHDPCESYEAQITVITEEQKKEEDWYALMTLCVWGAVAVSLVFGVALVLRS